MSDFKLFLHTITSKLGISEPVFLLICIGLTVLVFSLPFVADMIEYHIPVSVFRVPVQSELTWDSNKNMFAEQFSKSKCGYMLILNNYTQKPIDIKCDFESIKNSQIYVNNPMPVGSIVAGNQNNGHWTNNSFIIRGVHVPNKTSVPLLAIGDSDVPIRAPLVTHQGKNIESASLISIFGRWAHIVIGFVVGGILAIVLSKIAQTEKNCSTN